MEAHTVQAEYSFQGENNDELRFIKGDIITVTQREDGGWWEGTLNDTTGWFPSNYVKEYKGKRFYYHFIRSTIGTEIIIQFVVPFYFGSTSSAGRNHSNTRRNQSISFSCIERFAGK